MNGEDWISDKGLAMSRGDAGALSYKVLPRQFVPQHGQPFQGLDVAVIWCQGWWLHEARFEGECSLGGVSPLGGWQMAVWDQQPWYNFSTWFCCWIGGVNNCALNPEARTWWFQVTCFLRPPILVLTVKKLWCLSWTHLECSLTVAGDGLNLALSFAVLPFLGKQQDCCCSFCQGLWASRAAAAPSPCSSCGTRSQLAPSMLSRTSFSLSPLCQSI